MSKASEYGLAPDEPKPERKPFGWFKAMRNPEAMELLARNPNALVLAYVIAFRAQYSSGFNRHHLKPGEALLGDFKNYRMTEQNYRTAKKELEQGGFATFRVTPNGTIGRLINTRLFSVLPSACNGQSNRRVTDGQRAANGRPTTTKITKKVKKEKKDKIPSSFSHSNDIFL